MSFMHSLDVFIYAGIIIVAFFAIGLIFSRLYIRATKEISFVRTGMGGQKVIVDGGCLVLPVVHDTIPINMNTLRLEVQRANDQALITRDRMRVDVLAEFNVRVQPTRESIASAAQTLGKKTMNPDQLRNLVEGKFVDALRAVAAEMAMEELHEQRVQFVQKVQTAVSEDLLKNGLELESVSLTGLDQTNRDFFNPNNAFDAAGLTKLTDEIEERRKRRNEIEQDTEVAIKLKNLDAERQSLQISRDAEYARLEQEREIEVRRASQASTVASEQAEKAREAEEAKIGAQRSVQLAQIVADRRIEEEKIAMEQDIKERDIARERSLQAAEIDRERAIKLADQDRNIAISEKSRDQSEADAAASNARALAVKAEESVITVRDTEVAERQKAVDLVEARRAAEREAIQVTVAAEAKKTAADDEADAIRTLAEAGAEQAKISAEGEAEAEKLKAAAAEVRYAIEAAGQKALHEADNVLSEEVIAMKVRLAIIENLQSIVRESVKPMENIDGIKIVQVDGLTGGDGAVSQSSDGSGKTAASGETGLADQVVRSALQFRSQAPLIDAIMREVGISGGDLAGLTDVVKSGGQGDEGSSKQPQAD